MIISFNGQCTVSGRIYHSRIRNTLVHTTRLTRTMTNPSALAEGEASLAHPNKIQRIQRDDAFLVKKLSDKAIIPKRGSSGAAGYDLASAEDTVIPANGKGLVKTDLAIAIPRGTYARVAPRSGLALKHFIDTGAGVVDEDYRGNVGVVLFNHGSSDFKGKVALVSHGDRIAQLILERIMTPEVTEVDDLDLTVRGAGGYGSTGVNQ